MSQNANLADRVEALKGVRVLCIGDVMLDRYVYGEVERISPEAPIPVMRITSERTMLGGAGNVVRNLVALGARPSFLSVVGDDAAAREIAQLAGEIEGLAAHLVAEPGRRTTIKTRYVAGSQQLLRADSETTAALKPDTAQRLLAGLREAVAEVDAIVLSDYGKGVLSPALIQAAIAAGRSLGRPVVVDPKGRDYAVYSGATLVTPNRKELVEATGLPAVGDAAIVEAARALAARCGIAAVLVTRSHEGMTLVADGAVTHLPAEAREVYDVSGAGDTVVATLAAALAGGTALADAARLANLAAGIVVGKIGTAVTHANELLAALHHQEMAAEEAKIMTLDAALEAVARWRRKGLRVGFTNGCFDLLHPGHVSLLQQARAACDRLVVGLNADASVKRLKGPTRPVQPEAARATVLASLSAVDAVVLFGADTPIELIAALRPDVLVKGADYTIDKVVGADLVQGYGGRVVLAELAPGHSTTATIARLGRGSDGG